ncbi:anther-specific proline-rich protein APG-like [Triticum urartu]|uniref:anther-specific proline-rich protein APG-like n=1 Tax=Triticum urartu TaxID=4572 RepID=UPI0020436474|nr:anther-specific proline-rich protein APG-like [Triticum urartu]
MLRPANPSARWSLRPFPRQSPASAGGLVWSPESEPPLVPCVPRSGLHGRPRPARSHSPLPPLPHDPLLLPHRSGSGSARSHCPRYPASAHRRPLPPGAPRASPEPPRRPPAVTIAWRTTSPRRRRLHLVVYPVGLPPAPPHWTSPSPLPVPSTTRLLAGHLVRPAVWVKRDMAAQRRWRKPAAAKVRLKAQRLGGESVLTRVLRRVVEVRSWGTTVDRSSRGVAVLQPQQGKRRLEHRFVYMPAVVVY